MHRHKSLAARQLVRSGRKSIVCTDTPNLSVPLLLPAAWECYFC